MVWYTDGIELVLATVVASLLSSMHCVGMCAPFAIMAATPNRLSRDGSAIQSSESRWSDSIWARSSGYHLGRLSTYLVLGFGAGLLSWFARRSGVLSNVGLIAGGTMIAIGFYRLWTHLSHHVPYLILSHDPQSTSQQEWKPPVHRQWVERWSRTLATVRRRMPRGSAIGSAYAWGLTSTLLPCGWLYLFVIAASSATSTWMASATMVAFWLGTLPWLSLTVWGWNRLGTRWQQLSGPIASFCIVLMGTYLLMARSSVDFSTWMERRSTSTTQNETGLDRLERMRKEMNAGLPCCIGSDQASSKPGTEHGVETISFSDRTQWADNTQGSALGE